jgi:uncharacterized membrane-anchored protein YitT (DUF2179 family)
MKFNNFIRNLLLVIVSAVISAFNYNSFVDQAGLFPGGFAGIATLITRLLAKYLAIQLPFGIIYIVLNIIVIMFVFRLVGKNFTVLSMFQVTLVSLLTMVLPKFHLTSDIVLLAVFGGLISGVAIAIALSADGSSGGTDFIAVYFSRKYNVSTWNYVMYGNAVLLVIAGLYFGWDKALYSLIYQFTATQVINSLHLRYQRVAAFIITEQPEAINQALLKLTHHGVTIMDGTGGYTGNPKKVLYTVISSYEVNDVLELCRGIDSHVFVNIVKSEKILGSFYQKPPQ